MNEMCIKMKEENVGAKKQNFKRGFEKNVYAWGSGAWREFCGLKIFFPSIIKHILARLG